MVELLTACKLTLSFFLGFFLQQQHLTMQMRKRRRRTAAATATAMSAHLGTGATFREWRWTEELKPSKNIGSAFKPLAGASALRSWTFRIAPIILKRPRAGRLRLESIPQVGSKDVLRSQSGTVPLCTIPTPMDPAGKGDLERGRSGYTALGSRTNPRIMLPERAGPALLYSRGIRLSQPPRKPGRAVVAMATGLLASGEAVAVPFLAATAMAKLG